MNSPKLSIVIPVFNEGVNLSIMLRVIEATLAVPHETLVVYDFPEDDSIPVTKKEQATYPAIRLVHNDKGRGAINAIRKGIEEAHGTYVVTMVADDIGPVFALSAMTDLMDQGCALVTCTRYAFGGRLFGEPPVQKFLSKTANWLFRLLTSSQFTDITFGVKMFRRELYTTVPLESRAGWAILFELCIKVQALGLRIGEVPITSINRFYGGEAKFSLKSWIVEYLKWFVKGMVLLPKFKKFPAPLRKRAFD